MEKIMKNYSFYCKYCGDAQSFDTKGQKKAYEKYHYIRYKDSPRVKVCRNLVRTTRNSIMRTSAALKIDEEKMKLIAEKAKEDGIVDVDWDKLKRGEK